MGVLSTVSRTWRNTDIQGHVRTALSSVLLTLFFTYALDLRTQRSSPTCASTRDVPMNAANQTNHQNPKSSEPIVILAWTVFHNAADRSSSLAPWFHNGGENKMEVCHREGFLTSDQKCEFTFKRSRIREADAVLFRARMLDPFMKSLPRERLPHQHFIVYENEPPHKTWYYTNLTLYNDYFNLTATYSWDSDIVLNTKISYEVNHDKYFKLRDVDFTRKKRTDVLVAWFVSRCPSQSKREDYVKEMQKYTKVDVYGKCGSLVCQRSKRQSFTDDDCIQTLLGAKNSYKFYLAFENSLCEDYVTEKIWKVLDVSVIPIVMGAVEYGTILPKDSYIDVRDYQSPKHLVDRLLYLNDNDEEYNRMLRIKQSLKPTSEWSFPLRHCVFCQAMHKFKGKRKTVHQLDAFWSARRCIRPEHFIQASYDDFGFDYKNELFHKPDGL